MVPLLFDAGIAPSDVTGEMVTVRGVQSSSGQHFQVTSVVLRAAEGENQPLQVSGQQNTIVILVRFSDVPGNTYSPPYFGQLVGVDMNAYYVEASFGSTYFSVSVTGSWYNLPREKSWYIDANGECLECFSLISDGVTAADMDVDYSLYERVFVVPNSGFRAYAYLGAIPFSTNEGTQRLTVSAVPETAPMGTFAHEMGHELGLPDLYDYDGMQVFVGRWGLMAAGSWNGPSGASGTSPAHPVAWSKLALGWISPSHVYSVDLSIVNEFTLVPLELDAESFGPSAVQVASISLGSTYYLVEVRRQFGFDAYLPGEGVLISYVDGSLGSGNGIVKIQPSGSPAAYQVGQSFYDDVNDVSIEVVSTDGTSFFIRVSSVNVPTVVIDDAWVTDDRADVGSTQHVHLHASWKDDQSAVTSGSIYVNGQPYSPDEAGWIVIQHSRGEAGRVVWTITGVDVEGTNKFEQVVSDPSIIWDRIRVTELWVSDSRSDVASVQRVYAKAIYEYDSVLFTGSGILFLDGIGMTYDSANSLWYLDVTSSSVTRLEYQVSAVWDDVYGLTQLFDPIGPRSIVWDIIECYYLELDDERVDVGASIVFRVKCRLSYDHHELGSGDSVDSDFGSLAWDETNSWFETTKTQSTVGDYTFDVVSGHEASYDITALTVAASPPTGIWDRIEVYHESVDDERVDVDVDIEFRVKARLEYDGHPLESGDAITGNIGPLAWDSLDSWFYGTRRQATVGSYDFAVSSAVETTYGITALHVAVSEPTGVWDRVDCYYEAVDDPRVNVNSGIEFRVRCRLEYDGHELSPSDIVAASFGSMTWDPTNSWFEAQRSQETVGSHLFSVSSVSETTYGITALFESADNPTGIYDRIRVTTLSAEDTRIDVNTNSLVQLTGELEYDGHSLASDDTVLCKGLVMSWAVDKALFEAQESKSTVQAKTYDSCDITEVTYGITEVNMDDKKVTVIWDRVRIVQGGALDLRIDVGTGTTVWFGVYYEYDGSPLEPPSSLVVNGVLATWNSEGQRWEVASGISEEVSSSEFQVASIADSRYGLTVYQDEAGPQTVIWDKVSIQLKPVDERIDIGGEANIGFDAVYLFDLTPFSGTITLNDTSLTLNIVGSKAYTITNIIDSRYALTLFASNSVVVVWDRVEIELTASSTRVDIDSQAVIEAEAFYEYDGTPFNGDIRLNNDLTQNSVGLYIYTVDSVSGGIHGITVSQSNSVEIVFDLVQIQLRGPERVQVGKEPDITWTAVYAYDGTPFQGGITLSQNTLQDQLGPATYSVVSILDELHGLAAFTSDILQVAFDLVTVEVSVEVAIPGQALVQVNLAFASDGAPIGDATVKISGVQARPEGDGIYTATLSNWWVTVTPLVEVSKTGFSSATQEFSSLAIGNIVLYVVVLLIVGALALYSLRRKRRIGSRI
ncbi:MAG: M6 family metalloprotease domain-containing protein [Candidatus Geothermarchaeales archaeon]